MKDVLLKPPEVVTHFPNGVLGGLCLLTDKRSVLVCLRLQGLRVGNLHGSPGDDHEPVRVPLVHHICVNLVINTIDEIEKNAKPCLL